MKKTFYLIMVLLLTFCATKEKRENNDSDFKHELAKVSEEQSTPGWLDNIIAMTYDVQQKNFDVHTRGEHGESPLHTAISLGLGHHYDPETEPQFRKFIPQITREHYKLIQLIIAKGVDVNAINKYGSTPMHYLARKFLDPWVYRPAFGRHWYRIARLLIRKGADVTIKNKSNHDAYYELLNPHLMYYPISSIFRKQHVRDMKRMELLLKRHMK